MVGKQITLAVTATAIELVKVKLKASVCCSKV